jgi:hypothetical protein
MKSLDRRTFLRGTGVSLALPLLDAMTGSVQAAETKAPRRLACVFFPNGVSLPEPGNPHHKDWHWFPHGEGKDFTFTKTLESLEPHRNRLSVLGGLSHPSGRKLIGHAVSDVFLTGSRISNATFANSISVDQAYAAHAGEQTRLPSLVLSSAGGIGKTGQTHTLSYTKEGQPIPAEDNLRRAFNRMFGSGAAADLELQKAAAQRQKSMLDRVLDDANSLNRDLGRDDRKKLDEYLSSVRELERRVVRSEHWLKVPAAKVDEAALQLDANPEGPLDYIRAMYDLMFHAFQTDTTRAATYLIGTEFNGLSDKFPVAIGLKSIHGLSHGVKHSENGYKDWALWDQFLAQQLAYFLKKLQDTREGDGNLLDRTLVFHGCSTSKTHLARNYPLILAGGGAFGLKHGRYHKFDENKKCLADLFVTVLNALGVETRRFADSTGNVNDALC